MKNKKKFYFMVVNLALIVSEMLKDKKETKVYL